MGIVKSERPACGLLAWHGMVSPSRERLTEALSVAMRRIPAGMSGCPAAFSLMTVPCASASVSYDVQCNPPPLFGSLGSNSKTPSESRAPSVKPSGSDDDSAAGNGLLPFPAPSELNGRVRRLITAYQRESKKEELRR